MASEIESVIENTAYIRAKAGEYNTVDLTLSALFV